MDFRNEPSQDFSETSTFIVNSSWETPKGHPNLKVFSSKIGKELFKVIETQLNYSNLAKEECQAIQFWLMTEALS